jgi:hypothetical protein
MTQTVSIETELLKRGFDLIMHNEKFAYKIFCRKFAREPFFKVTMHYTSDSECIVKAYLQVDDLYYEPFSPKQLLTKIDELLHEDYT